MKLSSLNQKFLSSNSKFPISSGFTLIELMVTIGIFVFMTALILARYGSFNSGTLFTNTAYDIALTIRQAQTYGISVLNNNPAVVNFNFPYGVIFSTKNNPPCSGAAPTSQSFVFFTDSGNNGTYSCQSKDVVNTYTIKQGAYISSMCLSNNGTCSNSNADTITITFKRPDPSAIICKNNNCNQTYSYANITVTSSDNSASHTITVRQNGQISVQ